MSTPAPLQRGRAEAASADETVDADAVSAASWDASEPSEPPTELMNGSRPLTPSDRPRVQGPELMNGSRPLTSSDRQPSFVERTVAPLRLASLAAADGPCIPGPDPYAAAPAVPCDRRQRAKGTGARRVEGESAWQQHLDDPAYSRLVHAFSGVALPAPPPDERRKRPTATPMHSISRLAAEGCGGVPRGHPAGGVLLRMFIQRLSTQQLRDNPHTRHSDAIHM